MIIPLIGPIGTKYRKNLTTKLVRKCTHLVQKGKYFSFHQYIKSLVTTKNTFLLEIRCKSDRASRVKILLPNQNYLFESHETFY